MKPFESLVKSHEQLLALQKAGEDVAEQAQAYIDEVRNASSQIVDPNERALLRASLRYWASSIYDREKRYPYIELDEPAARPQARRRMGPLAVAATIAAGAIVVVLLVLLFLWRPGIGPIYPGAPTRTPTLDVEPEAATATPTQVPAALDTPTFTATPSLPTPTPTTTPDLTPSGTPIPITQVFPLEGEVPLGDGQVDLVWTVGGDLGQEGLYALRVWREEEAGTALCFHTQTEKTIYRFDPRSCPGAGAFCWQVQAVQSSSSGWIALSDPGGPACFAVAMPPTPVPGAPVIGEDNLQRVVPLVTLEAHAGPVLQVSFSPDARALVTGGGDGTFRVWSVPEGRLLAEVHGHEGWTQSVAYSPDGGRIVSGDSGRTVRLWDATALRLIAAFAGHEGYVLDAVFSPDGRLIASAGGDGTVRLWDVETGERRAVLSGGDAAVYAVSFRPDGAALVAASSEGWVQIWDLAAAALHCKRATAPVWSVAFAPDGSQVAAGNGDGNILILRAEDCARALVLEGHTDDVNAVVYSPEGGLLVSGSQDRAVLIWLLSSPTAPMRLGEHGAAVETVAWSADGTTIASGSADGTVTLWGVK